MKYIRTKDGKIFNTQYEPKVFKYNWNAKFIIDDNNLIVYDTVFKDRIANHGQILKQADTIEELCDGFYYDDETEFFIERFYHYNKNADCFNCDEDTYYKLFREDFRSDEHTIYGFIKTDKGLIYVAKMNDKGELELL